MIKISETEKTREMTGDELNQTRELTESDLNQVSAGLLRAGGDKPVKYMEFKLKEVLI